jgi:GTP-binding protein
VSNQRRNPFCVADIPGLIKGAHEGVGLGIRFLKHIERTRLLIHLIDVSGIDPENPLDQYETVNRELSQYSDNLVEKPQLVVLNKMDIPDARAKAERFCAALVEKKVEKISALTGDGLAQLINTIADILDKLNDSGS